MEQVDRNPDGSLSVKALNDSTLSIRLSNAFPPFLGILSMSYASVVSIEGIDHIQTQPIGTGPFKFQYWKPGVKLVLLKNESYFESSADFEIPQLDAVSISFLIDRQTAFMEFIKGNFEYMSGIDARYKDELLNRDGSLRNKYQSSISMIREPFMNTEYVGFFIGEEDQTTTDALMFRKAVNMAVDREKMLRFLRNNVGKPGHGGMIPYGMPGHDQGIGYRFNLAEAVNIIETYNLKQKKLTISTTAEYADLMKFIQSQLQDIGIEVVIEVMPAATMRELRANGQLEAFRASWVADYPDAENYLSLFLSRNKSPAGPNYTHFGDSIFDISYTQAMGKSSIADREKAYRRLDSMVMQQAPVMVLYYDEVLRFVHKSVKGLGSNPTNLLDLRFVSIEKNAAD
jgi:peptide/nickel transport system substrate-binding protein